MGLITKEVEVRLIGGNIKYFKNLGYKIPRYNRSGNRMFVKQGTKTLVKVEDLPDNSNVKVDLICDNCGKELKNTTWVNYKRYVREDGKYYCKKCAIRLYGIKSRHVTTLKNSKSFQEWCIVNNRQDVLDRWDYKLNNCKPSKITFSTHVKYYFKCPKGIHKSELKNINRFTSGIKGTIDCKACNSFAQWGIDNLCKDFLEKYWDYEKNTVNPWMISFQSNKIVWIKCQEKNYHGSYSVQPNSFVGMNSRCPYCLNRHGKVHFLDSIGSLYPKVLSVWSDKNKSSPYEYAPYSTKKVWWKCPEGKHNDYYRTILASNKYDFRCPDCNYSKGEEKIYNYLSNQGFITISQEEFSRENNHNKHNRNYLILQMKFNDLLGLSNGLLSYDFYLPYHNLLIEFQGEQHKKYIEGFHKSKKDFEIQQEHDRRKREYAQNNNIKLLEIWYWDYDKIESILEKEIVNSLLK